MTTEALQTLNHIPNSRARRAELRYRLDRLERADRIQLLCLALDDPYPLLRHDIAEGFQEELQRGDEAPDELDDAIVALLESVVSESEPTAAVTKALGVPRELLPEASTRARITACVALEGSPFPERTVEVIAPLLDDDDGDLRYQALIATNRLVPDSERLHDVVVDALDDGDPEIVVVATQIAVMHGWDDLLPQFLHARARLSGEDRTQVTFSVGELIDNSELEARDLPPEARGDMIAECSDALDYEPHTAAAIKTLANLDAQEATDRLVRITKGWFTHPILKVEAAAALVDLGNPLGEEYLDRALGSRRKDASGYALRIVGERRLKRFYPRLVDIARGDNYHSDTATLALADFGGDDARAVLTDLANTHGNAEVRKLARSALNAHLTPDPDSFDATLDR